MNGIYLTEQAKQELDAKIAELEQFSPIDTFDNYTNFGKEQQLKEILSSATIIPVEESWEDTLNNTEVTNCIYSNKMNYPNGVIIQPKQ